jgi:hypothetical protein
MDALPHGAEQLSNVVELHEPCSAKGAAYVSAMPKTRLEGSRPVD